MNKVGAQVFHTKSKDAILRGLRYVGVVLLLYLATSKDLSMIFHVIFSGSFCDEGLKKFAAEVPSTGKLAMAVPYSCN